MFDKRFFVAKDRVAVALVFRGEHDDGQRLVDQGVGPVLHLARRVALGVDVGDFLELERALERDGVMDAAAEVEEVAGIRINLRQLLARRGRRCAGSLRLCRAED